MKFQVFHVKNPTFGFGKRHNFPSEYERVAIIECDTLEDVFRVTNHIDSDWTTNPEVKWRKGTGANTRSTSVGDMVIDGNGMVHRCEMAGWKQLKHYLDFTNPFPISLDLPLNA